MLAVRAIFILALVCLPMLANANSVLGQGKTSCTTWASDRQRNQTLSQLSQAWVLGYVSGYNEYSPTGAGLVLPNDTRRLMVWIDNYCDANPMKDIIDAVKALVVEFAHRPSEQ